MSAGGFDLAEFKRWSEEPAFFLLDTSGIDECHKITLQVSKCWGGDHPYIKSVKIQSNDGKILETLIHDRWYFCKECLPDSAIIPVMSEHRPTFILIENGAGNNGVKLITVSYDNEEIWTGEIPMNTGETPCFPIAIGLRISNFHKPSIHALRGANVTFCMDFDDNVESFV